MTKLPWRTPLLAVLMAAILLAPDVRAEEPTDEESFSVVLLPDTQFYSEKFPHTYVAQTLWIREQLQQENIKFVIHLGDIVEHPTKEDEWKNAHEAMSIIDGVVPYSMVPGNHDMVVRTRDSTLYNKYFSPKRFVDFSWYGGHKDETNDNNYCYFEAAGMKFLVISLEYRPRDETLEWALQTAKDHPDHRVIVATHRYMTQKGRDSVDAGGGNSGEQMWQKFVRKSPNVFLVVSGHFGGVGFQTSANDAGGQVFELLTDYQNLRKGGDGWLRHLRFFPAQNKIQVNAYSPVRDETNEAEDQTFSIEYAMPALQPK